MPGGAVGYETRRRAPVEFVYSAPRLRNLNEAAHAGLPRAGFLAEIAEVKTPEKRDRALVQRMAAGDGAALASLYDQWVECIYALVFQMLRDVDGTEDVVEESFWQAWRTADRQDPSRASVGTWLVMIARSRALDHLRAQRRRREQAISDLPDHVQVDLPSRAESPLERVEQAERRARVEEALGGLPREQRQVVEMAFFGGFSQSEIARELGHPLGTVKTRVRLAMRKLRARLWFLEEGDVEYPPLLQRYTRRSSGINDLWMPIAARVPSAAPTMASCEPGVMSPAAYTPGTVVSQSSSTTRIPSSSASHPSSAGIDEPGPMAM